jgi:hypothetical protein
MSNDSIVEFHDNLLSSKGRLSVHRFGRCLPARYRRLSLSKEDIPGTARIALIDAQLRILASPRPSFFFADRQVVFLDTEKLNVRWLNKKLTDEINNGYASD